MKRLMLLVIVALCAVSDGLAEIRGGGGVGGSRSPQARSRHIPSSSYTVRKRNFSMSPTYDWSDDRGNSGTMRQRPYSLTPTWDFYGPDGSQGTLRQRPFSLTPTWDFSR